MSSCFSLLLLSCLHPASGVYLHILLAARHVRCGFRHYNQLTFCHFLHVQRCYGGVIAVSKINLLGLASSGCRVHQTRPDPSPTDIEINWSRRDPSPKRAPIYWPELDPTRPDSRGVGFDFSGLAPARADLYCWGSWWACAPMVNEKEGEKIKEYFWFEVP